MKHCNKCKETKERAQFYTEHHRTDGLARWCKPCMREACKDRAAKRKALRTPNADNRMKVVYPDRDSAPRPLLSYPGALPLLPIGRRVS